MSPRMIHEERREMHKRMRACMFVAIIIDVCFGLPAIASVMNLIVNQAWLQEE